MDTKFKDEELLQRLEEVRQEISDDYDAFADMKVEVEMKERQIEKTKEKYFIRGVLVGSIVVMLVRYLISLI